MDVLSLQISDLESSLLCLRSRTNTKEMDKIQDKVKGLKYLLNLHGTQFFKSMDTDEGIKIRILQLKQQLTHEKQWRIRVLEDLKMMENDLRKKNLENELLKNFINKIKKETKDDELSYSRNIIETSFRSFLSNKDEIKRKNSTKVPSYEERTATEDADIIALRSENDCLSRTCCELKQTIICLENDSAQNIVQQKQEMLIRNKLQEVHVKLTRDVDDLRERNDRQSSKISDMLEMNQLLNCQMNASTEHKGKLQCQLTTIEGEVNNLKKQLNMVATESREKQACLEEEITYLKSIIKTKTETNENLQKYLRFLKESYETVYG